MTFEEALDEVENLCQEITKVGMHGEVIIGVKALEKLITEGIKHRYQDNPQQKEGELRHFRTMFHRDDNYEEYLI